MPLVHPKRTLFHSLCPYRQVEQSGDDDITPRHPPGAGAAVPVSALPAKRSFFLTSAVVLTPRKEIAKRVEKCSRKDNHGQFHRAIASITGGTASSLAAADMICAWISLPNPDIRRRAHSCCCFGGQNCKSGLDGDAGTHLSKIWGQGFPRTGRRSVLRWAHRP